jgi:hypothetical protein
VTTRTITRVFNLPPGADAEYVAHVVQDIISAAISTERIICEFTEGPPRIEATIQLPASPEADPNPSTMWSLWDRLKNTVQLTELGDEDGININRLVSAFLFLQEKRLVPTGVLVTDRAAFAKHVGVSAEAYFLGVPVFEIAELPVAVVVVGGSSGSIPLQDSSLGVIVRE